MAAAIRTLAVGLFALQAIDADPEQQLVLVHQRGGEPGIGLAPFDRHPVVTILGEQVEPVVELLLVEQARLVHDEVDELLVGHSHAA